MSKFRVNSLSIVYHCAIHNLPTFRMSLSFRQRLRISYALRINAAPENAALKESDARRLWKAGVL